MMFELKINTDNAIFKNPATGEDDEVHECGEIVRILYRVIKEVDMCQKSGTCIDWNGNVVGEWKRD